MRYVRSLIAFMRSSLQAEMAYRINFFTGLLNTLFSLGTGILGISILFSQVRTLHGWNFSSTLVLLGVYLTMDALCNLCFYPSFEDMGGLDGAIWTGRFDFLILRPLSVQYVASVRHWRFFSLFDLLVGIGVIWAAIAQSHLTLTFPQIAAFLVAMFVGLIVLYSILLAFSALVFWSPGILFTWIFNSLFQMARYPVGLYPGWVRLILTWVIPVGIITTIPAQALTGELSPELLVGGVAIALVLLLGSSMLFHKGLRRYASASS